MATVKEFQAFNELLQEIINRGSAYVNASGPVKRIEVNLSNGDPSWPWYKYILFLYSCDTESQSLVVKSFNRLGGVEEELGSISRVGNFTADSTNINISIRLEEMLIASREGFLMSSISDISSSSEVSSLIKSLVKPSD